MYANTTPIYISITQDSETRIRQQAQKAYIRTSWIGQLSSTLRRLVGRSNALTSISEQGSEIGNRRHAGTQTIDIYSITGSLGRSEDFDRDFHPISEHTIDRWIGVAVARLKGIALPPVELVRIGSQYAVVDGHHRISVARAYGERYIDAEVTIWS